MISTFVFYTKEPQGQHKLQIGTWDSNLSHIVHKLSVLTNRLKHHWFKKWVHEHIKYFVLLSFQI